MDAATSPVNGRKWTLVREEYAEREREKEVSLLAKR